MLGDERRKEVRLVRRNLGASLLEIQTPLHSASIPEVGRAALHARRFRLQPGDSHLPEIIRRELAARGPLPFAWFMEQALYHPQHGYYSSGRCEIGRGGDYFTNVSVGPLFGQLLAAQFAEMWDTLGRPADFAIVEQGAHGGHFAHDALTAAQKDHPEFFRAVEYIIIEAFPILRERQKTRLDSFHPKVSWHRSLEELPPFRGVHFSNELLDALPVHLVRWNGEEWAERHVSEVDGAFAFVDLPVANERLAERLRRISLPLPVGYETEVNLAAFKWIETLAHKLTEGLVVAVDYGWSREEFYAPQRSTGTLRSYRGHRVIASPLDHVGEIDITAHVEWTSLIEGAEQSGLSLRGFTDQHHFITGLLAANFVRDPENPKMRRALQTLLHPGHLGMRFQFLVLQKNVPKPVNLSGLRFARLIR